MPEPESAAVRYERDRIDKSGSGPSRRQPERRRLSASVAGRSSLATGGRKQRTARLAGATIRLATMRGAPGRKWRRDRRWGSKAEPSRSERSRRMRGVDAAPCGLVPRRRRGWSRICTGQCAVAGSCSDTLSTMIARGKLIDRRELRNPPGGLRSGNGLTKQANPRHAIVRRWAAARQR